MQHQTFLRRYEEAGWKYKKVEPKQAIRLNPLVKAETAILERLKRLKLKKILFLQNGYWVTKTEFSIGATPEYLLGLYSIQEAAAQLPAIQFTGVKDKIVLDACAAPGGKTVQLANLMMNTGVIIALDINRKRTAALTNHLERCQVENTIVHKMDAKKVKNLNIVFDRILLDVPCSGNFVTDNSWFNTRTIQDIERNANRQRELLVQAVKVLKDDGEIVYSTCSLEPEENELTIHWAIKNLDLQVVKIKCFGDKGLTRIGRTKLPDSIERCRRIWPGLTQGFFLCKLRKSEKK